MKICERFGITYSASITTNGFLLTSSKFEKLVREYDVTNFQITIDGDGESHDSQRVLKNQKGSYARILDNLPKIKFKPRQRRLAVLKYSLRLVS